MVHSARPAVADQEHVAAERPGARLAKGLATTPGRMRLASVAIVIGLLVLVVVGTGALRARHRAATAVGQQAEPLLVGAEVIYTSLADADATATNTFLTTGVEPPARRQAYLDDLAAAADQLTKVARQAGSSPDTASALGAINRDLPTYSGLIEAARVNNRLGLPVGAAYLREASTLMQTEVLPAVGKLYQVEAARLNRAYGSGRSWLDVVGVLGVGALAIVGLALCQHFLAGHTNRLLNPPLLVATLLTVVLLAWSLLAFTISATRLREAQIKGSDAVQLLSSARILVSRAQADENLALVARGSGGQYQADFAAVTAALGPADGSRGLLVEAQRSAPALSTPLVGPDGPYAGYLKAHGSVGAAETSNQFARAVEAATASATGDELPAATQLSTALVDRIERAQTIFDTKAGAAAYDLSRLGWGMIGLVVLAAALAILGLQLRINEYR